MTPDFDLTEILLRGAAASGFAGLALTAACSRRTPAHITGALFCVAAVCHTLIKCAPIAALMGPSWPLFFVPSVAGVGLLWAFSLALFRDREQLSWSAFVPTLALIGVATFCKLNPGPWASAGWLVHEGMCGALTAHLLIVVGLGWRADLVERRRAIRGPVIAIGALYVGLITVIDFCGMLGSATRLPGRWDAVCLVTLSLASLVAFLQVDPVLVGSSAPPPEPSSTAVPPEDLPLMARLAEAMDVATVWKREDLGIGDLAQLLAVPEHRLRKLINERLGYRNFSAYVNERRIAEAMQLLSDPDNARKTVSAIAYATGFGSLGPFNRAFKSATGETPTEWRRRVLSASPNVPKAG